MVTFGGAERVAMVPPEFASVPTASQLTGLAQATPRREADAGRGLFARPSRAAVGRGEDVGAAHGSARRRADAADGFQSGRSGGGSQVVPGGSAVRRADDMGSGGQAGRVAGARDAVEDGRRRGRCLRDPGGPAVVRGEDHAPRAAGRQPRRRCSASESGQEMPVKLVTIPGKVSVVHVAPPLLVAMMLGDELPKSLTA